VLATRTTARIYKKSFSQLGISVTRRTTKNYAIEILSSFSLNSSSGCEEFFKTRNDVVVKVLRPFLTVMPIVICSHFVLVFHLRLFLRPIPPTHSQVMNYSLRRRKIKTSCRRAGKHSLYLGNKIGDRGLNFHFDIPSLEDLGCDDGTITYDAPTTAPN